MSHHIVDFKNISYSYPDGSKAVESIDLRIHHGESVAIVGANGAGKSTMLKLLVGILTPEQGEIRVEYDGPSAEIMADTRLLELPLSLQGCPSCSSK